MNKIARSLFVTFALASVLLSACGAAATPASAPQATEASGFKVLAAPTQYTGVVQAIDGARWTISGRTLDIDPSVVRDGPFQVGDTVKIEAIANPDGSLTVTRVEMPGPDDLSGLPDIGDDNLNGNDNANDNANSNDANENDDVNSNGDDDNSNGDDDNSNDDDSNSNDSNSNDDSGDDDNSNDDDSSGGNSGSGGGDDDDGGDDD